MEKNPQKAKGQVIFYEGYKGNESPRWIILDKRKLKIDKILWKKRSLDKESGKTYEIFKCRIGKDIAKITVDESGEYDITFFK